MLVSLLLAICFTISNAQFDCGANCLCFNNLVDCSRKNLRVMPTFDEVIILSTEKLLLRHMPKLDLSNFDISKWINLNEINLKGKLTFILHLYFNTTDFNFIVRLMEKAKRNFHIRATTTVTVRPVSKLRTGKVVVRPV